MNEFTTDRKALLKFLPLFGKELDDISFKIEDDEIEGAVGHITHYIRSRLPVENATGRTVTISDVQTVMTFLKASKDNNVTFKQSDAGKTLHINCGNSKLQLPTSTYVKSQREVGLIERIVNQSEANLWTKWVSFPLDYSASINTGDIAPAIQMAKVVGDKLSCKTDFSVSDGELVIHAGKGIKAKMFVRVPLINPAGPTAKSAKATFGYWLPILLDCLPAGEVEIHTGDDTEMVFKQGEDFLLVLMDQNFEED